MKKNKIKLIILDLYGVIVLGSYKETCIYMSKKYKLSFQLLWDTFYVKYFNQAALGKITDQQSFQYAIRELNIPIKWDVL
ncbi:hypothetical protein KKF61_00610, partial [Patescibacteria group bacterium]|nr:hypothetical protein [Patescibacteria group bacterium]